MLVHTLSHYGEALAIAKFKVHQCILMTDSPVLMLAKVSRYMVFYFIFFYITTVTYALCFVCPCDS